MKVADRIPKILHSIEGCFSGQYKAVRRNIALSSYAVLRCGKVNTAEIARHMGEVNGLAFKTNDMRFYRFLNSRNFQIDDKMWRGYNRLLFGFLKENGVKKGDQIIINVDYTSDCDDFLILCASVFFCGQSIPVYFSMRNYPKRKGQYNQKKMEVAFFKALRHILPKGYVYTIVADRGFGHERIIHILDSLSFKYVLRLNENLNIKQNGKMLNLKDLPHKNRVMKQVNIVTWDCRPSIVKCVNKEKHWVLATNFEQAALNKVTGIYEGRFSIEKMFKNQKSGGFDIERINIKKYDRFKKFLFICCVSYAIMIFAGLYINNKNHPLKKSFSLHANLLSAFLPS